MKKIFILITSVILTVSLFILIDSGNLDITLTIVIVLLIFFGPLYHAYRSVPEKMPNYWMFIVFLFSLLGYALFLFFLFNKDRLGYYQRHD